jgi:flagellar basal-body rod protein FlgC
MGLFDAFRIAGSGMAAQGQRLNVVSSNLANVDSITGPDSQPYRAKQVVFEAIPTRPGASDSASSVQVKEVVDDPAPARRTYDPSNPLADTEGYVTQPNVNVVEEMVNMISASRAYQTNVEVMNTAKALLLKTLTLGS